MLRWSLGRTIYPKSQPQWYQLRQFKQLSRVTALSNCSAMWRAMLGTSNIYVGLWRNQTGLPFPFPIVGNTSSFGHLGELFSPFLLPRFTLVTFASIVIGQ